MRRYFVVRSNSYKGDTGNNVHLFTFGEGEMPCFRFVDSALDWCSCESISSIPTSFLPKFDRLEKVIEVDSNLNKTNKGDFICGEWGRSYT